MQNHRAHQIEVWHRTESELAAGLKSTILDSETSELLLQSPLAYLANAKNLLLPNAAKASSPVEAARWYDLAELELSAARKQLVRAQELVDKYGPNIQLIGD
jgi:hypothetical protein